MKSLAKGKRQRSKPVAHKFIIQGSQVVKTQAHFPPLVCGSSSAEKRAFHNMPRTCLQELPGKQKGGILNVSDTLMNKVILLTDREKCSPHQAKQEHLRSKYKPCNRPWQARRARAARQTPHRPQYIYCWHCPWQTAARYLFSEGSRGLTGSLNCRISYNKVLPFF